jgi:hypothetical protein
MEKEQLLNHEQFHHEEKLKLLKLIKAQELNPLLGPEVNLELNSSFS